VNRIALSETDAKRAISEANGHQRKLDELRFDLQGTLDLLSAENSWLKERIRALEGQELRKEVAVMEMDVDVLKVIEVAAIDSNSAVSEENEHNRKLDELQWKLDLLSIENNGLKERICALEGQEKRKDVAVMDVALEVGDKTKASDRRPSVIASVLMALEDTDDTEETEEHELGDSMWDACLFLGCKDESKLKGESMNVGGLVTIFGVLALAINLLIQTAIVAVVVYKMANNADIDDGTAADMRHVSRNG
jgi:hypothetical protein